MEIIILTAIICTLFVVFIFGPLFYAHAVETTREDLSLASFLESLSTKNGSKKKNKKNKEAIRAISRTISDMESDGIYFPENVRKELQRRREEICEYSGLPSVNSYEQNEKI